MRIGLIGFGRWGRNWARVLKEVGVLGNICDRLSDPEGLRAGLDLKPNQLIRDLTQITEPHDGFVVATPAMTHSSLTRVALERGYHVLVEKPMALSYEAAELMVAQAELDDRVLMVGHILEHHPAFLELERKIHQGAIGEIRHISSRRLSFGRVRTDEDVIWSFAPHDIAMIQRLMGGAPTDVRCSVSHSLRRNLCDSARLSLDFDDRRTASIEVSWHSVVKEHRLMVTGSSGVLLWDDVRCMLTLHRYEIHDGELVRDETEHIPGYGSEPLANERNAFIKAIETGQAGVTDGRSGMAVIQTIERAQASKQRYV